MRRGPWATDSVATVCVWELLAPTLELTHLRQESLHPSEGPSFPLISKGQKKKMMEIWEEREAVYLVKASPQQGRKDSSGIHNYLRLFSLPSVSLQLTKNHTRNPTYKERTLIIPLFKPRNSWFHLIRLKFHPGHLWNYTITSLIRREKEEMEGKGPSQTFGIQLESHQMYGWC